MRFIQTALLLAFAVNEVTPFSTDAISRGRSSRLYSTVVELETGPPAEAEEKYGTIVGDTKGAALLLDDVAICKYSLFI